MNKKQINKHLIMGTAGHVDHGKTTLIKALTGFDCDTHKQEKERGITINLGFSHVDLPSGNSVGIVDVPGHADFIKTMVSGASGIDFVVLIIAADEGIMPQTKEHLQIMNMLGINHGLIVLSKADAVDEELLELAEEEMRDFVEGTFLEDAKIMKVSSITGSGIKELIAEIDGLVKKIPAKDSDGSFRMYIDRIFSVEGFGTVANGSVLSGKISNKDTLQLLPINKEVRIRRLEHHGKEVEELKAGDRGSINLAGIKQKEFNRGMCLSDKLIESSKLIDVRIDLFEDTPGLNLWSQVIFLLGTNRYMARVHLLDSDFLAAGKSGLAQVYLPDPLVAVIGDHFIIRNSSATLTLGGGSIIDPYPLHHRRRRKEQVENVQKISEGVTSELVAAEVRKTILPISYFAIADHLNVNPNNLIDTIFQELPGDVVFFQSENDIILLNKKQQTALQNKILTGLREYHKEHALKETGKSFNEILGIYGQEVGDVAKVGLQLILDKLKENNKIKFIDKTWCLADHGVRMDESLEKDLKVVEDYIISCETNVPLMSEMTEFCSGKGIDVKRMKQLLSMLVKQKKLVNISMNYIHAELLEKAKAGVIAFLQKTEDGISLAQFRDMMQANRKFSTLILEYFDKLRITIRRENARFLTKSFSKKLEEGK